jgi:hypothetical protein
MTPPMASTPTTFTPTTTTDEPALTRIFDRQRWIDSLPYADEEAGIGLVMMGRLIPGPAHMTRIATGALCLTFATADVLSIADVPNGSQLEMSDPAAPRKRLVVRRGAVLWDVCPDECVTPAPPGRQPFAFSSRPSTPRPKTRSHFTDLETDFLRRAGLTQEAAH